MRCLSPSLLIEPPCTPLPGLLLEDTLQGGRETRGDLWAVLDNVDVKQPTNHALSRGISISLEQRFVVTLWHHGPRTQKNRQRTQVWNMDQELSHLLWHWLLILMLTWALYYATWMSKRNGNRTENNNLSTVAIILPPYMHCQHTGLYCTTKWLMNYTLTRQMVFVKAHS